MEIIAVLVFLAIALGFFLLPLILACVALSRANSLAERVRRLEMRPAARREPVPVTATPTPREPVATRPSPPRPETPLVQPDRTPPVSAAAVSGSPRVTSPIPHVATKKSAAASPMVPSDLAEEPIALAKPTLSEMDETETASPETFPPPPTGPVVAPSRPPPLPPRLSPQASATALEEGWEMFIGRRLISVAGIGLVLLAVAFGLAYAIRNFSLPPELRLIGAGLFGMGLTAAGMRLRRQERMRHFALVLMGGGAGVLYLTVYATYGIYHLIGQELAALGLVAVAGMTLALAVLNASQTVALIGTAGAFAMPFMVATATPRHDFFLLYLLTINLPVLALGERRNWQLLYNGAFAVTAFIGLGWLFQFFVAEPAPHLVRAGWFWGGFALEYLALALLKLRREEGEVARAADLGRLTLLTVLLGGVGWLVLEKAGHAAAQPWLFAGGAVAYFALAATVRRWRPAMFGEFWLFLAGATGFLGIAVSLRFDGSPVALLWGVEGVAVIAYGLKLRRQSIRGLGAFFLAIGIGHALLLEWPTATLRSSLCLNVWFATVLAMATLLAVTAVLHHYLLAEEEDRARDTSLATALAGIVVITGFGINAAFRMQVSEHVALGIAAGIVTAALAWAWLERLATSLGPLGRAAPGMAAIATLPALFTLLTMIGGDAMTVSPWVFCAWAGMGLIVVFWAPSPTPMRPAGMALAAMSLMRALIVVPTRFPVPERWLLNGQVMAALTSCGLLLVIAWRPPWERRRQAAASPGVSVAEVVFCASLLVAALFVAIDATRVHGPGEIALLLGEAAFVAVAAVLLLAAGHDLPRRSWWRKVGLLLLLGVVGLLLLGDLLWLERNHGGILANRIFVGQILLLAGVMALLLLASRRAASATGDAALRLAAWLTGLSAGLVIVASELSRLHQVLEVPRDWSAMAVTVWITLFAVAACLAGIARRIRAIRHYGFAVLALAMLRILGDIWDMADPARIFALLGVGLMLLALSFIYHRVAVPWLAGGELCEEDPSRPAPPSSPQ